MPLPDFLVFDFPKDAVCLVTDVGDPVSRHLVDALRAQGWPVVVLRFPSSVCLERPPVASDVSQVTLMDMSVSHLEEQLAVLQQTYGPVRGFIHVSPWLQSDEGIVCSEFETLMLRHVFLMAKYLQPSLTEAASEGRAFFVTVTQLDGVLGLACAQEEGGVSVATGGLSGLTKTLNLEWGDVFCRAIDIAPDIDAVPCIMAELHDPNRLVLEVGYSEAGRVTLAPVPKESP